MAETNKPKFEYSYIKADENTIKYDGCTAITGSNWKQLAHARICWYTDNAGSVGALSLVVANWPNKSIVDCLIAESVIRWDIANILETRFNQE